MKKTFTYINASIIGFGLLLSNCSKKTDLAPTSANSTTTTSATSSGTATTGSTTSATSSGSTSGTTSQNLYGSGKSIINNEELECLVMYFNDNTKNITVINCSNKNYFIKISVGNILNNGNYSIDSSTPLAFSKARIDITNVNTGQEYIATSGGTVTVSGKNLTFTNVKLTLRAGNNQITASANLTLP